MLSLWFECILLLYSNEVKSFFEKNPHKTSKVILCLPAGVCRAARNFLAYLRAMHGNGSLCNVKNVLPLYTGYFLHILCTLV